MIQNCYKFYKIILIAIGIIGVFCLYKVLNPTDKIQPANIKVVEIVNVVAKDIQQTIRLIGTIQYKYSTTLKAKTIGTIDFILPAGQKVQKETLIAKIANADIEQNYHLSSLSEKIANTQYERAKLLLKFGNLSHQAVEEKKNIWIEAQKVLANVKIELDKTKFFAPFDGMIGIPKIRVGSQVQVGDKIVNFYNPLNVIVEFNIPDSIINLLQDSPLALINDQAYPLSQFQKIIDEENGMCPAFVEILCENCIIGKTIDIDLILQQHKDVIVIPFEAVLLRNGRTFVYIVQNEKAILTPIELGIQEKEEVEVISGLQQGDNLIVQRPIQIYPDMPVKIYNRPLSK